jgi:hypothetical protein
MTTGVLKQLCVERKVKLPADKRPKNVCLLELQLMSEVCLDLTVSF